MCRRPLHLLDGWRLSLVPRTPRTLSRKIKKIWCRNWLQKPRARKLPKSYLTHKISCKIFNLFYIHLGQHFVIVFLIGRLIYAWFPSPITLIVLQVALIAAAGIVLYFLARHYLSLPLSVMIVASYCGANGVMGSTLGNFYENCQIPLFIFSLLLALEKQRWPLFWLFAVLTLGTREDAGISLFGIGAYLIVSRRYPRIGIAFWVLSFSYVVFITNTIMPMFSADNSRLYLANYFRKFVKTENPSTLELLWAVISQPQLIIEVFF